MIDPPSITGVSHLETAGRLESAACGMILIHGRGAGASDILSLHRHLFREDCLYAAPEAASLSWYPYSFLAPTQQNQPGITNGLDAIQTLIDWLGTEGIEPENIVLAGFSQGACLVSEFTARNARRYGGVLLFSGGLIGPDDRERHYGGQLEGTPVFAGCNEADPHIPSARFDETVSLLTRMGADVEAVLYDGDVPLQFRHTIVPDEIRRAAPIVAHVPKKQRSGAGEEPGRT